MQGGRGRNKQTRLNAIEKPLLAASPPPNWDSKNLGNFPVLATPKIDGIRVLKVDGKIVSRTKKPLPNQGIAKILENILPNNVDGELVYVRIDGTNEFNETQSKVMTKTNSLPSTGKFVFFFFDFFIEDKPLASYKERIQKVAEICEQNHEKFQQVEKDVKVVPLIPTFISSAKELTEFEAQAVAEKHEGIMVRKPEGVYKFGRSTFNEGILIKRFQDSEAQIIGFQEQLKNQSFIDNLGETKRSTKQEKLVPAGILGSFLVRNLEGGEFSIGTGFTLKQREEFWQSREKFLGKFVKYQYFTLGENGVPRFPSFLGFRHEDDIL